MAVRGAGFNSQDGQRLGPGTVFVYGGSGQVKVLLGRKISKVRLHLRAIEVGWAVGIQGSVLMGMGLNVVHLACPTLKSTLFPYAVALQI